MKAIDRVPDGTRVFIDANTFVYHFTARSPACREFLARCERREVEGVTSVLVLVEVTHRLLMEDAVAAGVVARGNLAAKLRQRPDAIRGLHKVGAVDAVQRIPLMGIAVLGLELPLLYAARELRARHGLMTNDSLLAATAKEAGIGAIATSDRDFERVDGLTVYAPGDLASP